MIIPARAENMCVVQYDRTETEDNSGLYWNVSTYRPLPVQITGTVSTSATGANVFPEFDASKMVAPTVTTVANSQSASAITHGCTGACRRVTVCNAGTTNPICIKFSNAWSRGLYLPARAAATSAMSCVSAYNVTSIYGDSNTSTSPTCAGGSDVYVIPEDD